MNAFLLTWNPRMYNWEQLNEVISYFDEHGYYDEFNWSCGRRKTINLKDRLFLIRVGVEPKGIIGSGYAIPHPDFYLGSTNVVYQDDHWNKNNTKPANYLKVLWDNLFNPSDEDKILKLSALKNKFPNQNWTPQSSGIIIRNEYLIGLEKVWGDFYKNNNDSIIKNKLLEYNFEI